MKQGLNEINDLVGVWGCLICTNGGDIIADLLPPGMNQSTITNITQHIINLLVSGDRSIEGLKEIVLHYSQRKLFVIDLELAILVIICTPSVDISLLRLTANVVINNWENDQKIQKQLNDHFVERL
jgi:predicted regulator of Ras-like GTPase activity (Roadblock/LC7/MglB family)